MTRLAWWLLCSALALACGCGGEPSEPEPSYDAEERLPGGDTTNTRFGGRNAFSFPAANITEDHEADFFTGNSFFNLSWVQAPSSTDTRDGLGPLFNARSCSGCHLKDGRGRPPLSEDEEFLGLLIRLSVDDQGTPDPVYGGQLQNHAILGVLREGQPRVSYEELTDSLPDGTIIERLAPRYTVTDLAYGPLAEGLRLSPRVAPIMVGLGLLEAIPRERLEELADPDDADGDGISGRVAWVTDMATGAPAIGRFGWKGEMASVGDQVAAAFLGDMGITSPLLMAQNCTTTQMACLDATGGGDPEISPALFLKVTRYSQLLAVPAREGYGAREVLEGKELFSRVGCQSCHVPRHVTGEHPDLPEVSGQVIFPYTDLLLHDLGEELSDGRALPQAEAREWRTPPLWGLGRVPTVNGHNRLLHDGRARGVAEAIAWHGGEAAPARDAFFGLSERERAALVRFIESL